LLPLHLKQNSLSLLEHGPLEQFGYANGFQDLYDVQLVVIAIDAVLVAHYLLAILVLTIVSLFEEAGQDGHQCSQNKDTEREDGVIRESMLKRVEQQFVQVFFLHVYARN